MRHFKNELNSDVSLSYDYNGTSMSKTIASGVAFEFPEDFNGPVNIGVSQNAVDVRIANGAIDGNTSSNPK